MTRRFLAALSFTQRLRESTVSTTNSTPTPHRRKWTILACVSVLACTTVVFATVGSTFRSKTTQIHLVNHTGALALVAQEVIDGRTRLQFKNISAKALNGFVLGLANQREIELDTTTGDRVIAPGEVQDIVIPGPSPSTITILAVMYSDGSLEGDPITVAQLRDKRSALKAELKRIFGLVVAEAQSRDADIPGAFDRLESAMSKLPSPVADDHTPQANAQRAAKEDVASLLEFMRHRQERSAHLNQRELIRELRERIERRIAGL